MQPGFMRLSYAQAATLEIEECPASGRSVRLIKPGEGTKRFIFNILANTPHLSALESISIRLGIRI
jgi:hypothetical protein